ncbi:hypothetical protein F4780DRAFT_783569 [Xylariomycetidae sp. FL0641]|nr:hypothetical protein F4780DRAFT_783569 [Xylariomycetidae sp. FL0641]
MPFQFHLSERAQHILQVVLLDAPIGVLLSVIIVRCLFALVKSLAEAIEHFGVKFLWLDLLAFFLLLEIWRQNYIIRDRRRQREEFRIGLRQIPLPVDFEDD